MKRTGIGMGRWVGVFLIAFLLSTACSLSALGITPGPGQTGKATDTPVLPTLTPEITATYPCPVPTQELPPRVDPLTSPTDQSSQVVHILPGNYDEATIEMESGTFTGKFNGGEGALVEVKLLPNTVNHLKVTVRVHQSTYGGCTYGGYDMSVVGDRDGKPLEIIQGMPPTPSPVTEAFGSKTFDRLKQLARLSFTDRTNVWDAIFGPQDLLLTFGFGQGVQRWQAPAAQSAGALWLNDEGLTTTAALSPDGGWLAINAGNDPADPKQVPIRLWDLKTGKPQPFGENLSTVESLAFSPSSKLLASGGNDNTVMIWGVPDGRLVATLKADVAKLANGTSLIQGMRQLFWMDDSTLLARGDAVVYAWKVPSGERILELGGEYQNMDFDRASGWMVLVREDGVYLRDPSDGQLLLLPDGGENSRGYKQVTFSPDGSVVVALNDQKITFWDTITKRVIVSGRNPTGGSPLVFSPDWRYLARVNWDERYVTLWGVQP